MHPVIEWGGLRWPAFGPIAVLAFALAVAYAERRGRRAGFPRWTMTGAALFIVGGAWLGARVVPMIVSPKETFESFGAFVRGFVFTAGAWYGGLAGGLLGLVLFARRRGLGVAPLLDVVGPPLLLSQVVGRFACLAAGCDHGSATTVPWAITFRDPRALVEPSLLGVPVHPTQVYESLGCLLLLLAILLTAPWRSRPGSTFLATIGGYAALRFGIEFFRGDPRRGLHFGGALSTSQLASIAAAAIVAGVAFARRTSARGAVAAALFLLAAAAGARASEGDDAVLRRAASELSSDDYATRERATRALAEAGESARAVLEEARRSTDPEARHRAESLLVALSWRAVATPALAARVPELASRLASARGDDLLALVRDLHVLGAKEALPALKLLFADAGRAAEIESALESAPFDVRIAFESALAAYSGPEVEPTLLALARSPHAILRRAAVSALGDSRSPESAAALEALSKHPDPATAAAAARALLRSSRPPDLAALAATSSDAREPEEKRRDAIAALGARGDRRAVPALVALLRDPLVDDAAALALAALRAADATPALRDALGSPDEAALEDSALFALARCAGLSEREFLLAVLGSRLASDTAAAAIFAGLAGTRERDLLVARAALARLRDGGAAGFVAIDAVPLLDPLPDAEVVPALARLLAADAEGVASRTVARSLARRGASGRAALREAAGRAETPASPRASALAAFAARGVAEPADAELARRFAAAEDPVVRGAAVRLLAAADPAGARETVLAAVESLAKGRGSFRPGLPDALRAIGALGRKDDAARVLEIGRREASLAVAAAALEALFDLGDPAAARALIAAKPSLDAELRVVAARAIARRGLRAEADLLLPILDAGDPSRVTIGEDGAEPSLFARIAPRDVALDALVRTFGEDAGGADLAARAAAWRDRLAAGRR